MDFGDEIENTKGLIGEIEHFGIANLDEGDYDIIKFFVENLEPYMNHVESFINMLEIELQNTYSDEIKKDLDLHQYKFDELSKLIPQLKNYMKELEIIISNRK